MKRWPKSPASICCGVVDDDTTGIGRGEALRAGTGGPDVPPAGINRWIVVAALFVGVAVFVGGIWVAKRDAKTPIHAVAPSASSRATIDRRAYCREPYSAPSLRAPSPNETSNEVFVGNGSPVITEVTAIDRTTVRLRWVSRPHTGDQPIFIVRLVCENGRMYRAYFAHEPEFVFRRLDPAGAPFCFQVEEIRYFDWLSQQRCLEAQR